MTRKSSTISTGGIGFTGALFLLFLGLKLGGVINWSWVWVTAPLWIPLAIAAILVGVLLIIGVFASDV